MRSSETILLFRRLALFLRAGIPINTALDLLRKDMRHASARTIATIAEDVLQGKRLSHALNRYPKIFDPLHVRLIEAGEASGKLPDHLEYVASLRARNLEDRRRIMQALLYPAIVAVATIALTLFLTLYAFPKIVPLLIGFHQTLPLPTRTLIGLTNFLAHHGWTVAVLALILCIMVAYALRVPRIHALYERLLLRVPITGSLLRDYYAAAIVRTLATLLESGVSILPALHLLARTIQHASFKNALTRIGVCVSEGRPLASELPAYPLLFPLAVTQLIYAGERTGTLPTSLQHAAAIYEQHLEEQSKLMQALIEPVLMVCMGSVVGFVALAIITPIYGLTQGISAS